MRRGLTRLFSHQSESSKPCNVYAWLLSRCLDCLYIKFAYDISATAQSLRHCKPHLACAMHVTATCIHQNPIRELRQRLGRHRDVITASRLCKSGCSSCTCRSDWSAVGGERCTQSAANFWWLVLKVPSCCQCFDLNNKVPVRLGSVEFA